MLHTWGVSMLNSRIRMGAIYCQKQIRLYLWGKNYRRCNSVISVGWCSPKNNNQCGVVTGTFFLFVRMIIWWNLHRIVCNFWLKLSGYYLYTCYVNYYLINCFAFKKKKRCFVDVFVQIQRCYCWNCIHQHFEWLK